MLYGFENSGQSFSHPRRPPEGVGYLSRSNPSLDSCTLVNLTVNQPSYLNSIRDRDRFINILMKETAQLQLESPLKASANGRVIGAIHLQLAAACQSAAAATNLTTE